VSLPFETYKSTGKGIVLAHTLYTKGLQIMKCDQFCLCTESSLRVRHAVGNYCKSGILGRENNNSRYLSFAILCGQQIKSNTEFCVIRENSDIIPVNRKILILIPWTVHDTPPPPPSEPLLVSCPVAKLAFHLLSLSLFYLILSLRFCLLSIASIARAT